MDIVSALKPYQKVNHFPTMNEISRKDLLAKNYDRYFQIHFYSFFHQLYLIQDYQILFLKNIISLRKRGYYQMIIIYGTPIHQINRKNIHWLIFLNQLMTQWDKGNIRLVYFLY